MIHFEAKASAVQRQRIGWRPRRREWTVL